jgi:hypothetical protein
MLNQDITDLFGRVNVGTNVVVKAARRRGRPSLGKKTPKEGSTTYAM